MAKKTKATYPDLLKQKGEKVVAHQAFLLWASQHPDKRSLRGLGRLVNKDPKTIRDWRDKFNWGWREDQPDVRIQAAQLLQEVEAKSPVDMRGDQPIAPLPITIDEVSRRREAYIESMHVDVKILNMMRGVFAEQLNAGKVSIRPTDMPKLMQIAKDFRRELMEWGIADSDKSDGPAIVESFRVKQAKMNGTSLVVAMREDAQELTVILKAMEAAEARDQEEEKDALTKAEN
jgi:hypothetical protein